MSGIQTYRASITELMQVVSNLKDGQKVICYPTGFSGDPTHEVMIAQPSSQGIRAEQVGRKLVEFVRGDDAWPVTISLLKYILEHEAHQTEGQNRWIMFSRTAIDSIETYLVKAYEPADGFVHTVYML